MQGSNELLLPFLMRSFLEAIIMLTLRKFVREQIYKLPKDRRLAIFDAACLTDVQYEIMVQRFINRKSIIAITFIVHLTEDGVNDNIAKAYDSILGVLKECGTK